MTTLTVVSAVEDGLTTYEMWYTVLSEERYNVISSEMGPFMDPCEVSIRH